MYICVRSRLIIGILSISGFAVELQAQAKPRARRIRVDLQRAPQILFRSCVIVPQQQRLAQTFIRIGARRVQFNRPRPKLHCLFAIALVFVNESDEIDRIVIRWKFNEQPFSGLELLATQLAILICLALPPRRAGTDRASHGSSG